LTAIVQDLQQQATTIASSLSAKKREIKKKLAMVAKVQNALNGADIVHTEVLDQIHEKLLEFTPDTAE
jgi:protein-disulfide isomerase-like protein with CxxC motif